jgi:hypothetical protein
MRRALEELMATVFRHEFVDGFLDRGRAQGRAGIESAMAQAYAADTPR